MELTPLRYLLSTLETGSFSAAAENHRVSQQAVSKAVARLEQQIGAPLLRRGGRALEPTAAGKLLAESAQAVDAELNQVQRKLDELTGKSRGRLDIGAGPTAAVGLVAEVVSALLEAQPGLDITVSGGTTRSMTPQLRRGELDCFVSVLVQKTTDPALVVERLFDEPTLLITRANHPLARKRRVTLADSLKYPWLEGTGMEHWGDLIRKSFIDAGLKLPVARIRTSSLSFSRALLATTDYVCVLPRDVVGPDLQSGQLAAIEIDSCKWSRPMALFFRRGASRSPLVESFIRRLRESAAK